MDISIITIAFSAVTTTGGALALFLKHLREKRQNETERLEIEHLKERVVKLEEKCASIGDIENLKKTIDEVKDNLEVFHKEKREDVIRIYDRMEKLYEKVLEWVAHK